MKIRIYKRLIDGVFFIRVQTEDWSENDRSLMVKFGEPEIDLGGEFSCVPNSDSSSSESSITVMLDNLYARIMSESPFVQKFDSRDIGSIDAAKCIANRWCAVIEERITSSILALRNKDDFFSTEEITEV